MEVILPWHFIKQIYDLKKRTTISSDNNNTFFHNVLIMQCYEQLNEQLKKNRIVLLHHKLAKHLYIFSFFSDKKGEYSFFRSTYSFDIFCNLAHNC